MIAPLITIILHDNYQKKVSTLNKHSVPNFQARMSVNCTLAYVTSNLVTECLLQSMMFYENIMASLDQGEYWLACGVWINEYDYQNN